MDKYGPVKGPRGSCSRFFPDAIFHFFTSFQFASCFAEASHYTFHRIIIVYLLFIIAFLKEGGKSMTNRQALCAI